MAITNFNAFMYKVILDRLIINYLQIRTYIKQVIQVKQSKTTLMRRLARARRNRDVQSNAEIRVRERAKEILKIEKQSKTTLARRL